MALSCFQGSGTIIIIARAGSIPFMQKNSRVLSRIAESEPSLPTMGKILSALASVNAEDMVSSRAKTRSALPRMVLISPLWQIMRYGCARSQLGVVLVENLECTVATADT